MAAERDRGRLHQRMYPRLSRRIMGLILAADERRDRRDRDDRAAFPLRDHLPRRRLAHIIGAVHVDALGALERLGGLFEHGVEWADAVLPPLPFSLPQALHPLPAPTSPFLLLRILPLP